jgi:peptidoglycan hydrolase-like protein with peptidoglycan-binding domain
MPTGLLLRLLVVLSLLGAGLAGVTVTSPGHRAVVDITFPTAPDATFRDDYDAGRIASQLHRATDLYAPMGTPVYAMVGGRVIWAPGRYGNAGYALQIRGVDGRTYAYYHLGPHEGGRAGAYAPGITEGVTVARGQHIGFVGDSGNAVGMDPHLHVEIHDDRVTDPHGTNRVNPFPSLQAALRRGDVVGLRATGRTGALRLGARGPAVTAWQSLLNHASEANLVVDGTFGPATDRATRAFQRMADLTVDGVVGPASQAAATAAVAPTGPPPRAPVSDPTALLRLGDRGPAVATWQGQLNAVADAGIPVDGAFGPGTERATRDFQRAHGLVADGVVGPASRRALGS